MEGYRAIVAHPVARFRIIEYMSDSKDDRSASNPNAADGSPTTTPHPDDLRNIMLGRPRPQYEAGGTGDFSAEAAPETDPVWSDAQSDVSTSDEPDWQTHSSDQAEPETQWEYQRPPYYAETEPETETDRGHPDAVTRYGPPAGFGRRLIAYLIDNAITIVILSLLFPLILSRPYIDYEAITAELENASQQVALPTATPVLGSVEDAPQINAANSAESESQSVSDVFSGLALALFVTTVYNGILVGLLGTTVGKRALSVYVLDANGNVPGIPLAFGRALSTIVSTAIFYVGYLFILRHDNRALHDLMVGTYAITLTSDEKITPRGLQQDD